MIFYRRVNRTTPLSGGTAIINSIRAYLAEFGIATPVARRGVEHLLKVVPDAVDHRLPA